MKNNSIVSKVVYQATHPNGKQIELVLDKYNVCYGIKKTKSRYYINLYKNANDSANRVSIGRVACLTKTGRNQTLSSCMKDVIEMYKTLDYVEF